MKVAIKISVVFLAFLAFFSFVTSCDKIDDKPKNSSEDSIYWFVDGVMNYWYLWNDSIPQLDYLNYETPQKLMDAMMVTKDHWSFVDKAEKINAYFNEGEDFGYGFYLSWDSQKNLRVVFSYPGTDAYTAGIDRGCIINAINDNAVLNISDFDFFFSYDAGSSKFDFTDNAGIKHTVTLTKEIYKMKSVLFADMYNVDSKTVGYVVFQSFLGFSKQELENTFESFKSAGVTEVIIDLRFNGGGYVSIAQEMAEMLIPASKVGSNFFSYKFNADRSQIEDTTITFHQSNLNMNLSRVFFLTNDLSASASELVINCLKPHMNVKTIGGTTYGKPVVMSPFYFQDWVLYPVIAKTVNSVGQSDYYEGIAPDITIPDQSDFAWGDLNEPTLHQAMYYITNGSFDATAVAMKNTQKPEIVKGAKRLNQNLLILDK